MKESDKYAAAKTWEASIQIVKVEWLLECLKRWEKVNEKDYRLVDGTGDEEDNISTGDEEDEIETADEEENENKDENEDEKMEVEEEKEKKESNVDGSESRSESVELEGDQPTMQEMDAMRALFDDQPFDQIEPPQKRSLQQSPPKAKRIEKEEEEKEEREMEREKEKEREERENDHEKKESEIKPKSESNLDSKPNQELQSQFQSQSDSISESKSEANPDPQSAPVSNPPTDKPRYFLYSGGTLDPDLRDAILRLGGNYIETQYVSPFPHFP